VKSRRLRQARHVAQNGEERDACIILVEKPLEKRPLRRPRKRQKRNINMDLREIG
jgi:hypothetical protein